jgi:tetratricopeptide (TPR) repeat protein
MNKREQAEEFDAVARGLDERGRTAEAARLYRRAIRVDPTWSVPLYNLGLLYKKQRRWPESLRYNRRAAALNPADEAAWWNLGIAATALRRWRVAREAWRGFGIAVPDGCGPVDFPCGFTPVRLNPDGDGEVVWAHRLDPARAALDSIPLPESGFRWRDVVLNDGAPTGYRQVRGKEYPVFDALELFERSAFGTYVARVKMPNKPAYVDELARQASELEGSAEDWSTSVNMICKACSEGRPHEMHDRKRAPRGGVHLIGIAARDREHATQILHTWEADRKGVRVEWLADDPGREPNPS